MDKLKILENQYSSMVSIINEYNDLAKKCEIAANNFSVLLEKCALLEPKLRKPFILAYINNLLELIDTTYVLIKNCIGAPVVLIGRKLFEEYLTLHYVLDSDTDRKIFAYEIYNIGNFRLIQKKSKNNDNTNQLRIDKTIEVSQKSLYYSRDEYQDILRFYIDETKKGVKFKEWYFLYTSYLVDKKESNSKISNVEQLAINIDKIFDGIKARDEYNDFYSWSSEYIHGNRITSQLIPTNVEESVVYGLRPLRDLDIAYYNKILLYLSKSFQALNLYMAKDI